MHDRSPSNVLTYEGMEYYTNELLKNISKMLEATGSIPPGGIVMYSGSVNAIPTGWYLCDGQNGTPDLRERFVIGASDTISAGSVGGSSAVTLNVSNLPSHSHTVSGVKIIENGKGGSLFISGEAEISTGEEFVSGETGDGEAIEIIPPYYALAFIMKAATVS